MLNVRIDDCIHKDVQSIEINKATFKYNGKAVWCIDVVTKYDKYMAYCINDFVKCVEWITIHCEEG